MKASITTEDVTIGTRKGFTATDELTFKTLKDFNKLVKDWKLIEVDAEKHFKEDDQRCDDCLYVGYNPEGKKVFLRRIWDDK